MDLRVARLAALGLLALLVAGPAGAEELTISVAVSLKEAVEEIGAGFAARHPGVTLRYNLGASGALQKQIEAGAPVDVFLSAGERQVDELQARGLVLADTRRAFAANVLVVVAPVDARLRLRGPADLAGAGRLVIGNPRTVPAGEYAAECLRALGLWETLHPRLVYAENVRQALDYVARGEVDAGFVYATDAAARPGRVVEAFRPAAGTYRAIVYPAVVVRDSRRSALARRFVEALVAPEARAVLARRGFAPPPAPPATPAR